jgi:HPr kinase/phosphorylase
VTASEIAVHGTCLVLGEAGLLLRGPSGSGKSTLARDLIQRRRSAGGFAALVADDRVLLRRCHGRLIAAPHPAIAGMLEVRGIGIHAVTHLPRAVVRLVVDLQAARPERMPEAEERVAETLGVTLPRIAGRPFELAGLIEVTLSWQR